MADEKDEGSKVLEAKIVAYDKTIKNLKKELDDTTKKKQREMKDRVKEYEKIIKDTEDLLASMRKDIDELKTNLKELKFMNGEIYRDLNNANETLKAETRKNRQLHEIIYRF